MSKDVRPVSDRWHQHYRRVVHVFRDYRGSILDVLDGKPNPGMDHTFTRIVNLRKQLRQAREEIDHWHMLADEQMNKALEAEADIRACEAALDELVQACTATISAEEFSMAVARGRDALAALHHERGSDNA